MSAIVWPKAKQRKAGNRGETGTESEQEYVMIIFAHSHRGHIVSSYFLRKSGMLHSATAQILVRYLH